MSSYGPSPVRRRRRTPAEIEAIREAILEELEADNPQTVRGLFYRLVSRGAIDKTESEYKHTVGRLVTEMRRDGSLPYEYLADPTRWMRKPTTFSSAKQALQRTARTYRQALWDRALVVPEIWSEKDAITGVLVEETYPYDVALMPCRGYPSVSFLHAAAETMYERNEEEQRTAIYYFGDHDPSGVDIDRYIVDGIGQSLLALTGGWEFDDAADAFDKYAVFKRVAVLPRQIADLKLPTRPTKRRSRDYRAKGFVGDSVEVDAIPAHTLRAICRASIERHVDRRQLEVLKVYEKHEKDLIMSVIAELDGRGKN
jgi:hypothetical protein